MRNRILGTVRYFIKR